MARDEMIEELWQASQSGASLRKEWLDEFVRQPDAARRMQELLLEADEPTRIALGALLGEYADAPRRNASKPRRKNEWQRELAAHLQKHGPKTKLAKFRSLPRKRSHDEDNPMENALSLCGGKWEVYRDPDDRIVCVEDETGKVNSISFATFEDYLTESAKAR